ncbi:hypothetical protein GJ496_004968 [Pomphorhynchus laevis]|nr:hypothetical protein GJ496_004968 [Pomphorhynchus laevis]
MGQTDYMDITPEIPAKEDNVPDTNIRKRRVLPIPEPAMEMAKDYVDFLNESPSKYHAVKNCYEKLMDSGFQELSIDDQWNLQNGGKYFIVKNDTCLMSFIIGKKYEKGNPFAIVATHTDSPCFKIKPVSNMLRHNYALVGSSIYGGGNWLTYLDREFKIAGKVFVRDGNKIVGKLIHIDEPICYLPNLAIHFTSYPPNLPDLENNLVPVIGLTNDTSSGNHRDELLARISEELSTTPDKIIEFDLSLVDQNSAKLVGFNKEFIAGQNQDNLLSTFCSIKAIISASNQNFINDADYVTVCINFDNEEVGNQSPTGSETDFILETLNKIAGGEEKYGEATEFSFIVSCDVAHALHPNYAHLYEIRNRADIFGGISVKYHPGLNYTTNAFTSTIAKEIGRLGNVPTQDFTVRNDARSGSTLGPEFSAKLGIASVDVGSTMLAMHSIREFAGTISIAQVFNYIESLFVNYGKIRNMIEEY